MQNSTTNQTKLPKGTEIHCPKKRHLIATLNTEIKSGTVINVKFLDFEPDQKRIAGEQMVCKLCGSMYFTQGKLYTQDGWSPSEPNLEPVSRK